jgi:broad specificity phosphatase PhoE
VAFTHLFSSHLQRAAKTAGKIREAQTASADTAVANDVPDVVQLPVLMEQDFGFYEGKKWHERSAASKWASKDPHHQEHKDIDGFADFESKESMAQRVDTFLDDHLLPLIEAPTDETKDHVVAIVSHGIILSQLWKRFLLRLPPKSVSFSPDLLANTRGYSLEHIGGWSNTGYLELHMQQVAVQVAAPVQDAPPPTSESAPSEDVVGQAKEETGIQDNPQVTASDAVTNEHVVPTPINDLVPQRKLVHGWKTMIETVNGRDHLIGLKRTGGGVGSARHDASQKNIDNFFKRQKLE